MRRLIVSVSALAAIAVPLSAPLPAAAQGNPISNLFACEATGGKQEAGALAGAALGALLGSQISKNERGLGAAVGAGLGAVAGSKIGCRMQSTDQARARAAVNEALENGRVATWSNPQTGASGRVDVISSNYGPPVDSRNIRFNGGVQTLASYDSAAGQYFAPGTVNLRSGPSTTASVIGRLRAGETFDALGRAPGSNWLLVGQGGGAIGYVSESVVRASGPAPAAACRRIQASYATRGARPTLETYDACRDARGQWSVTNL